MAMQKHAMLVVKKSIDFINPGQIPVIVDDCPLHAQQKIEKKCQLVYPDEVGESKMVSFMGLLLAGSGWERMFSLIHDLLFLPISTIESGVS